MGNSSSLTPPTTVVCPRRSVAQRRRCEKYYKVKSREQIGGGGPYTLMINGEQIFGSVATTVWPIVFAGSHMLHFGVVAEGKWFCGQSKASYKYCLSHVMPDSKTAHVTLRVEFTDNYEIILETIKSCSGQNIGTSLEGPRVVINPDETPLSDFNKVADIVFNASKFKLPIMSSYCVPDKDGKVPLQTITSSVAPDHVKHYNFINCKRYFQSVASVYGLIFPAELDSKLEACGWKLDDTVKDKDTTEGVVAKIKSEKQALISSVA